MASISHRLHSSPATRSEPRPAIHLPTGRDIVILARTGSKCYIHDEGRPWPYLWVPSSSLEVQATALEPTQS